MDMNTLTSVVGKPRATMLSRCVNAVTSHVSHPCTFRLDRTRPPAGNPVQPAKQEILLMGTAEQKLAYRTTQGPKQGLHDYPTTSPFVLVERLPQ